MGGIVEFKAIGWEGYLRLEETPKPDLHIPDGLI